MNRLHVAVISVACLAFLALAAVPDAAADNAGYRCYIDQALRGHPDDTVIDSDDHYQHDSLNCAIVQQDCVGDSSAPSLAHPRPGHSTCQKCVLKYDEYHYTADKDGNGHWHQTSGSEAHSGICT